MNFWEHLDALRVVLFKIAGVLMAIGVFAFCAMPWMFDHIILAPCRPDFYFYGIMESAARHLPFGDSAFIQPFELHPMSLQLTSQFFIHVSASCWGAVVLGFPAIIYFLWGFVAPGLYDHEKQGVRRAFFFGNTMFFLGVFVGYSVVFPLALRFLATYQLSSQLETVVSLDSYMDNFFTIILLMGAVFELPLLAWLLGKMGFITRSFFARYRRHAIVALLVLAAVITPTGDPFTLFAVFIPVYALWEFSATLVPHEQVQVLNS